MCGTEREGVKLLRQRARKMKALALGPSESRPPVVPMLPDSMSDVKSDSILVGRACGQQYLHRGPFSVPQVSGDPSRAPDSRRFSLEDGKQSHTWQAGV